MTQRRCASLLAPVPHVAPPRAPRPALTVGAALLGIEAPVRRAVRVVPPAHTAGIFGGIGSEDEVTADSLEDPRGHRSFMKEKTRGEESRAAGGKRPPRHGRKFRQRGWVRRYFSDARYTRSETETLLRGVKAGKPRGAASPEPVVTAGQLRRPEP